MAAIPRTDDNDPDLLVSTLKSERLTVLQVELLLFQT
jgi:hypothetical protein